MTALELFLNAMSDLLLGFLKLTAFAGGLGILVIFIWIAVIIYEDRVKKNEKKNKIRKTGTR